MVLESREATKTYGRKTAADHVSLELEAGFVYAMLGPKREWENHLDEDGSRTCEAK